MDSLFTGMSEFTEPHFWVSVVEIIWINVLLSGDNAIVIALACRNLPPKQRLGGMIIGTAVALLLRLIFAGIVSSLMLFPYIKIVGGIALLWIAVKLLVPDHPQDSANVSANDSLWRAVRLIALADVVMSLDNVIAVAGAAAGNQALLIFGLGISVPAIVAGSTVIMALLNYFPLLIWAGAALLGWIAGDMIATDPVVAAKTGTLSGSEQDKFRLASSIFGVSATIGGGLLLRGRALRAREET
jgi:YjbE family integral membrane protein